MERHPLRWWALAVAVIAVLVDMIDNQIVTVALPTIQRQLGAGNAELQWISAAYALGFGLTLITGGRLGDHYGRTRLFILGMAGFTLASLLAGIAPDVEILVLARLVQGVCSGLMVPQVLSSIHVEFGDDERPKAMTIYAAAFPLGGLAGPLLGGLLTEADLFGFGWRAIFLVNLPIGVLALIGAFLTMPNRPGTARQRLDPTGLVLLTAGLVAIFYPLVQGREQGWPVWMILLMVASLPVLGLFAWHERRSGNPLIPPALIRGLRTPQLVMFLVNAAVGVFFVLTLHLQLGLGYSPLSAALTFLPSTVGVVAGNVMAMRRAFTRVALVVLMISLAAIGVLVLWQGKELSGLALALPLVGFGFGMGAALNAMMMTSMAAVRPEESGSASGIVNTTSQLGLASGIALFGTVFFANVPRGYDTATATALAVSVVLLIVAAVPKVRTSSSSAPSSSGSQSPA